jgi:hypothetical protein
MKKFIILSTAILLMAAGCNSASTAQNSSGKTNSPQNLYDENNSTQKILKILSLAPSSGPAGTNVTIQGGGFTAVGNQIMFGDTSSMTRQDGTPANVIATADSPDGLTLSFTVPATGPAGILCSGIPKHCVAISAIRNVPGLYRVSVANNNGISNTVVFEIK